MQEAVILLMSGILAAIGVMLKAAGSVVALVHTARKKPASFQQTKRGIV
jgi:hypothetical protein